MPVPKTANRAEKPTTDPTRLNFSPKRVMILDGAMLAVGRHFLVHGWCVPSGDTSVVLLFPEVGMRPRDVSKVLSSLILARKPVYLWGSPGGGKSEVVRQAADRLKLKLVDVRATLLDPVDLRGLPKVTKDRAEWCPPSFLPRSGDGVLFLDELAQAPPMVQAACLQLVLDRRIGEYELPAGCGRSSPPAIDKKIGRAPIG